MPWVTLIAGDNTLGTYNLPSPPRVGESIRMGIQLTDPMYRVTAVVWEIVPEMQSPEFAVDESPAMLAYIQPINREAPEPEEEGPF